MRKRKKGRKFSRTSAIRKAFLYSIVRALILKGRIRTTEARAKEAAQFAEKLVTKTRMGSMTGRRQAAQYLDASAAKKLMEEVAPRYKERKGGYTRVTKLGARKTDGARMAILEFV